MREMSRGPGGQMPGQRPSSGAPVRCSSHVKKAGPAFLPALTLMTALEHQAEEISSCLSAPLHPARRRFEGGLTAVGPGIHEDVDDRLGGKTPNRRRSDVLDSSRYAVQRSPYSRALALEPRRPRRVALDERHRTGSRYPIRTRVQIGVELCRIQAHSVPSRWPTRAITPERRRAHYRFDQDPQRTAAPTWLLGSLSAGKQRRG
jgi:hypothetical protein